MSQTYRTKITKIENPDDVGCTAIRHKARRPVLADPGLTLYETHYEAVEAAWHYHTAFIEYYGHGETEEDLQTFWERWQPMYAEQTQRHNIKIKHPTKRESHWKWLLVSISRLTSGRYEVTSYVS